MVRSVFSAFSLRSSLIYSRFQTLSSPAELREFFEADRTLAWIRENGYKRVALQLPDAYLKHAFELAQLLEDESGARQYILADTSYRR